MKLINHFDKIKEVNKNHYLPIAITIAQPANAYLQPVPKTNKTKLNLKK